MPILYFPNGEKMVSSWLFNKETEICVKKQFLGFYA